MSAPRAVAKQCKAPLSLEKLRQMLEEVKHLYELHFGIAFHADEDTDSAGEAALLRIGSIGESKERQ